MQALSNSKWISADKANGYIMVANRTSPGFWEQFDRKDLGSGNIALICKSDYKYASLTATNSEVLALGDTIGVTETFKQISNSDGSTSFLASNGKYVSVKASDSHLYATATTIGTTEKFNFIQFKPTPTPVYPSDGSLSYHKPVTASNFQSGNMPWCANDGNTTTTRWCASNDKYPEWWKVDLQSIANITRVDINWYNSTTTPRSYYYKIEVSNDDLNYTLKVDKTSNTTQGNTSDSFTASARYVRITSTGQSAAGQIYASAYEFKVFGSGGPTPPPVTPTVTPTSVPPTVTPTKLPPTVTPTSILPTATPTGVPPTATPTSLPSTPTPTSGAFALLSQAKIATASVYQGTHPPEHGNDGNLTTRWSATSTSYPQWWKVDLGASHSLARVDINWYSSSGRAYKYKIETSQDNSIFSTVFDNTNNTTFGDTSNIIAATGRYVRISVTGCSSGAAYASFYECKVYGY